MEVLTCLSRELIQEVLMYVSTDKILILWNSKNRRLMAAMNSNYFWKIKCKYEKYKEEQDPLRFKIFEKYLINCSLYWEKIFMCGIFNKNLNFNFENGIYEDVVAKSKIRVGNINYFDDKITIVTHFDKNKILVVNSSTGVIEKIFQTKKEICDVRKSENFLIAMLTDNLIVWDFITESKLLDKHCGLLSVINCIYKHRIGIHCDFDSDSDVNKVKIFNIFTNSFDIEFYGGRCIDFNDNTIAVGTESGNVKLFDSDFNKLWDFVCCERETIKLEIQKSNLLIYHGTAACIWNIISKEKIRLIGKVFDNDDFIVNHTMNENKVWITKIFTGNNSFIIVGYNCVSGDNVFEINTNVTTRCVISNNHYLFGIRKKYIYIWCIKTGKLVNRFEFANTALTRKQYNSIFLFATETKLAYQLKGILHVLDYDVNIQKC